MIQVRCEPGQRVGDRVKFIFGERPGGPAPLELQPPNPDRKAKYVGNAGKRMSPPTVRQLSQPVLKELLVCRLRLRLDDLCGVPARPLACCEWPCQAKGVCQSQLDR